MNQNTDFIHQAFAIVLFCIAVTILLVTYHSYIATLNNSKKIQKEEIMFQQYRERKENIVFKSDVITMLFHPIEYDLEIDGYLISKTENVKKNVATYMINHDRYKKSYSYDNKGNITRIIFCGL